MNLTPEQTTALLGGLITTVLAFLEYLRRRLAENTAVTKEAKDKAEEAKATAEQAQVAAESVQVATVDRLDYDRLRRIEAALLTLDECAPCRNKILEVTDRRRLRPRTKEAADAT